MTIKRIKDLQPKTVTESKQTMTRAGPDEPTLRFRDGWNFGLGFFTAAFVFSFVIVPTIACMASIALAVIGQGMSR